MRSAPGGKQDPVKITEDKDGEIGDVDQGEESQAGRGAEGGRQAVHKW